jgi:hypothetical protein
LKGCAYIDARQVFEDGTAFKADDAVFLNGLPKVSAVIDKLLG